MFTTHHSPWSNDEYRQLSQTTQRFCKEHIAPHESRFRRQHHVDRAVWQQAGRLGLILPDVATNWGGAGGDAGHTATVMYEIGYGGSTGFGYFINHIVGHYLVNFGTPEQQSYWLPGIAAGTTITSIAMTEPGTGSDLQAITTRAVRTHEHYVLNGAKTFITNGQLCDLVVVVARTNEAPGAKGISLLLVDTKNPGFKRGQLLDKIGQDSADTSEMFFDNCLLPLDSVIGGIEGQGFYQLMNNLPYERAGIAIAATGSMQKALDLTIAYTKERQAFGKALIDFQNTRFVLAELKATVTAARTFCDYLIQEWIANRLDSNLASMAKFWITDKEGEVIDRCLQLFGGYGYMLEYPIARMYADSRVHRIYGGANEIQKELVARFL